MKNLNTILNRIRRHSLLSLGVMTMVSLAACSDDSIVGPESLPLGQGKQSPRHRQFGEAGSLDMTGEELALDREQTVTRPQDGRRKLRKALKIIHRVAAGYEKDHLGKQDQIIESFPTLQEAVLRLENHPAPGP